MTTYLSTNFTLDEFVASQTADRENIDNTPPPEVVARLRVLAYGMESVRLVLGSKPISISSGYRSEPLEKHLTEKAYKAWCARRNMQVDSDSWAEYFAGKSHPKGDACDFICPGYGPPAMIVSGLIKHGGVEYDQLILEYPNSRTGGWVHISFNERARKQALVIDDKGTRTYA